MVISQHDKPGRVLIVDDNPSIHDDFRKILIPEAESEELADAAMAFFGEEIVKEESGLDVTLDSAFQGMEALQMVCKALSDGAPYDIAFVDMRMPPGWDGLTTIEKIWEVQPNIQLVICSAYSDHSWSEIAERLDNHDRLLILKKPFDNAEVLQLVSSLIQKQRESLKTDARQQELENTVQERTTELQNARQDSERLLAAIDSILVGIDQHYRINRWNSRASASLKIRKEDAYGLKLQELPIAWESPEEVMSFLDSPLAVSHERFEAMFRDDSGSMRCIGLSRYPILEGSEAVGAIVLGTDLTEHRVVQQQLQQAQKLESVGQLAAGVAHEINTPMQYVGDNLNFLKTKFAKLASYLEAVDKAIELRADSDPEMADLKESKDKLRLKKMYRQIPEALDDSIDGVTQVSRIVGAMKELSHPGTDEMVAVDLNAILQTTITVSRNEWKYVADIETDFSLELNKVLGLRGELAQVFLNLIVNAAHAISDATNKGADGKGLISITTKAAGDQAIVEILDNGGGIPESIRDRIFDPFFTTKDVGKGTGQGLAIAHAVIVSKHHGCLSFDVTEGVGTCFRIQLPMSDTAFTEAPDTVANVNGIMQVVDQLAGVR